MDKTAVIQDKETEEARVANAKEIERAIKAKETPAPPPPPVVVAPPEPVDPTTLNDSELQAEITRISHALPGLKGVDKNLFNKLKDQLERLVAERDARAAEDLAEKLRDEANKKPKSASEKATFAAKDNAAKKAEADAATARAAANKVKS